MCYINDRFEISKKSFVYYTTENFREVLVYLIENGSLALDDAAHVERINEQYNTSDGTNNTQSINIIGTIRFRCSVEIKQNKEL